MAKINGTDLRIYKDGNLIAYEREFTFSLQRDLPDASNKDSGGFAEHIQGQGSATLEFTAMVDFTANYGIEQSLSEIIARSAIYVSWRDTVNGTIFYAGQASYASISSDASNEDVVAWSGTITINGDWGIYPDSLTRTLRVSNTLMSFNASSIFGADKNGSFYYIDNSTGTPFRLKNGIENNLGADYDSADFIGIANDEKSAYVPYPSEPNPNIYKIFNGVKSEVDLFQTGQLFNIYIENGFAYCIGLIGGTIWLTKENIINGDVVWSVDTTYTTGTTETFQVIKQGNHIVFSYETISGSVWKLDVHNESTGSFIRTVSVVTDADTVGVWMAVLGTSLYVSYADGTISHFKKLTFNNTALSTIATASTTNEIVPLRLFNDKIYVKQADGGDVNIYSSSDVFLGIVNTEIASITDFIINNGVLIAYDSANTSIKCFPV